MGAQVEALKKFKERCMDMKCYKSCVAAAKQAYGVTESYSCLNDICVTPKGCDNDAVEDPEADEAVICIHEECYQGCLDVIYARIKHQQEMDSTQTSVLKGRESNVTKLWPNGTYEPKAAVGRNWFNVADIFYSFLELEADQTNLWGIAIP
ncbi:hypothetical protein CAPTEDRAFT_189323 [Capitella teleta]|uniref:Uncharacterized protein n=1 Tax=Capitella teleta TaxID=283909 RepID=R7UTH8_CAPTE|nr:hypothetical protein CAPTEDRAFT_189323 [Capitella teleta]|eukprot:ELU06691.1 hypothetical protein CAPTEDRAFT_189323 [Capitella teleta]